MTRSNDFSGKRNLLGRLDDPNIIKVVALPKRSGRPYLVTEPLRGESLLRLAVKREHSMRPRLHFAMMRQAAHGLIAAHRAGIVHRDVKPGNLFLWDRIRQSVMASR